MRVASLILLLRTTRGDDAILTCHEGHPRKLEVTDLDGPTLILLVLFGIVFILAMVYAIYAFSVYYSRRQEAKDAAKDASEARRGNSSLAGLGRSTGGADSTSS
jgi:hypothetical protein